MHYQRVKILKMTNNDVINFYMITPTNRNQNRLKRQKENQLPNEKVSFQTGIGPRFRFYLVNGSRFVDREKV